MVRTPPAPGFGQNNLNDVVDILIRNLETGFATVTRRPSSTAPAATSVPFISSISPTEGLFTGGTLVTIFGQGFDEPVAVELGGFAQAIISVTATEIVVRTVAIDPPSCNDVPEWPRHQHRNRRGRHRTELHLSGAGRRSSPR